MRAIDGRDGRITVGGDIGPPHLHKLCAALQQTVRQECSNVTLDFATCSAITQAVMLPLMPIVAQYRELQGIEFELIVPRDRGLARLFVNANWAHHIDPGNHRANPYHGGHVPALRFLDDGANGQDAILAQVMELIVRHLDTSRDTLKAVEWSLGEIMENVPIHAESVVGGFVQATAFGKRNAVEFVVADAGIGIPASMGTADDEAALRDAITEGVTRDRSSNAGNGLFGSYQIAVLSGGTFEICSSRGVLRRTGDGQLDTARPGASYPGTSVRCRIGLGDPELLGRALRFKGRSWDPQFDFVERELEDQEGTVVLNMKERASMDFWLAAGRQAYSQDGRESFARATVHRPRF